MLRAVGSIAEARLTEIHEEISIVGEVNAPTDDDGLWQWWASSKAPGNGLVQDTDVVFFLGNGDGTVELNEARWGFDGLGDVAFRLLDQPAAVIPEPASVLIWSLMAAFIGGLTVVRRRRR